MLIIDMQVQLHSGIFLGSEFDCRLKSVCYDVCCVTRALKYKMI